MNINGLLTNSHLHHSEYDGDPTELALGDEMEYTIRCKNSKISAETVVKLPQGTIVQEKILPEVYLGKVLRSLRRADPQVCTISCLYLNYCDNLVLASAFGLNSKT